MAQATEIFSIACRLSPSLYLGMVHNWNCRRCYVFSLIFSVILSMKTREWQSINLWWMKEGVRYRQSPFWDSWETITNIFSHVRYIFIFTNWKIICSARYRPKSIKCGKWTWIGRIFDIMKWGWTWIKIHVRPNFWKGAWKGGVSAEKITSFSERRFVTVKNSKN